MVAPTMSPEFVEAVDTSLHSLTINKIVFALLALVLCVVVRQIILRSIDRAFQVSRIEKSLHTFLRSLIQIALYAVTILVVADALDFPVTTLVAALSIAGLAITLAVQDSLSNLAGGILILSSKPFVVGDVIEALGVGGTVLDITLFYTKIATADEKIAFLPNRSLSSSQMTNHSAAGKRQLSVSITLPSSLKENAVRAALIDLAGADEKISLCDEARVFVLSRKPGLTEYALRACVKPTDYWAAYYSWAERAGSALKERFGDEAAAALAMQIITNPSIGDKAV